MGVWTMKCVGYDNQLQSELSEKFPVWNAMSQEEKKAHRKAIKLEFETKAKELGLRCKKTKGNKPKTSFLKKRKREETPDDSEEGESEGLEYVDQPAVESCANDVIELSDSDEDVEVPSKYRKYSEGTRLSPICL
ncbi:hypothetical protein HYPSUDRAFT_41735 [Hypholoma sublateritium FD-334 SS-4]|uniref:Uncharacterized protein n=1 Tax=Hypholoma sublateritium (strain FD-334 SS-4) TaxID=945553 RepID=A0A0D2L4A1_HYPSF|nr:hypothetical protein HYPSUDRAFT_41735 [Hypholoma sublateritium FD-334 SS-4]